MTTFETIWQKYNRTRRESTVEMFKALATADWQGEELASLNKQAIRYVVDYIESLERRVLQLKLQKNQAFGKLGSTKAVKAPEPNKVPKMKANRSKEVQDYRGWQRPLKPGDRVVPTWGISDGRIVDWRELYVVDEVVPGDKNDLIVSAVNSDGTTTYVGTASSNDNVLVKLSDFAKFPQLIRVGDVVSPHDEPSVKVTIDRIVDAVSDGWAESLGRRFYSDKAGYLIFESDIRNGTWLVVDTPQ